MKNLLAIATALTILMPVSGAFAQPHNTAAASHNAASVSAKKPVASKGHVKSHKHGKKQAEQSKEMPAGQKN